MAKAKANTVSTLAIVAGSNLEAQQAAMDARIIANAELEGDTEKNRLTYLSDIVSGFLNGHLRHVPTKGEAKETAYAAYAAKLWKEAKEKRLGRELKVAPARVSEYAAALRASRANPNIIADARKVWLEMANESEARDAALPKGEKQPAGEAFNVNIWNAIYTVTRNQAAAFTKHGDQPGKGKLTHDEMRALFVSKPKERDEVKELSNVIAAVKKLAKDYDGHATVYNTVIASLEALVVKLKEEVTKAAGVKNAVEAFSTDDDAFIQFLMDKKGMAREAAEQIAKAA